MYDETIAAVLRELRMRNDGGVCPDTMKTLAALSGALRHVAQYSDSLPVSDRLGVAASVVTSIVNAYDNGLGV